MLIFYLLKLNKIKLNGAIYQYQYQYIFLNLFKINKANIINIEFINHCLRKYNSPFYSTYQSCFLLNYHQYNEIQDIIILTLFNYSISIKIQHPQLISNYNK